MELESARAASEILVRHWKKGTVLESLPSSLRPENREDGYFIQEQIEALSSRPLFGWKIAATSTAGQRHIGIDGPIAGRLLAEMVHGDGEIIPFGENRMRVAEAEFAFRIGRDLSPRVGRIELAEVLDAVSDLYLAIEIPDSRYVNFSVVGGPQLIADNACAHRFVLGPRAPEIWRQLDLASHRVIGQVVGRLEREGSGGNVLGDPCIALTWLANELSALGITLAAGQTVTTGTCLTPLEINPCDHVLIDYGVLGQVTCRFDSD